MRNRILAISNHGFFLGGGEYSFIQLLSHLQKDWEILSAVPETGELARRLSKEGIGAITIPLPPLRSWRADQVVSSLLAYVRLCLRYRPALVYANGSRAALYGGIAGRLTGVPAIWHCRILDSDPYMDPLLCRLSSRIIVNSRATANRFRFLYQPKTRVVYNAVDLGWLRESPLAKPALIQEDWKIILVVARLSREKRHDILLSAFEQVAPLYPDLHLVCLGGEDPLDRAWGRDLQDRSRRTPCSERVHWVRRVEDVRPWYRRARVLALGSEKEAFGRVVVEAMACGLPVVATRVGGIPEIVRDGREGLLVAPGSVRDMAEALHRLLQDESLRDRVSRSGLERAKDFRMDVHVARITNIFEECIGK